MAKAIPRTGSRRNVRIGSLTDVRGRVVSWSSAGTCGFKGTRRGTPFAAQTAAANAIRTVVDQGMQRAEVMIKGPGLGRDAALRAIRRSGQADTIGIAMRRALLGEIEGTCITRVKSENVPHEYSTITGIQESVL
ncbi:UNVERIFIED_CONTAM: 30S ribosomal protein S11, chloroplastic [Sesamum calycinum]|uniref:30S ribosomal protein S11, chloroplastic n=1 Tax=Sesamum calycinum TaxID=2727403 RepID=A0AAW2QYS3_9LAMI